MKIFLTLFALIFSVELYAGKKINNFTYLFNHPNSHYFYTCGAGKLNTFGQSSCGSYLHKEYKKLIKELKRISGYKTINLDKYQELEILEKERLYLMQNIEERYELISKRIQKEEEILETNCITYTEFLNKESEECIEFKEFEKSIITKINQMSGQFSELIKQEKLNKNHIIKIESSSRDLIRFLISTEKQFKNINKSVKTGIILSDNYIAEIKRIAEEKEIAKQKLMSENKRLAKEKRVAEEKRIAKEKRLAEEKKIAFEMKLQEDIKSGKKLISAYVSYLNIKNLNDRYGSYSDLSDSKRIVSLIENYYKDFVEININKLWDKAVVEYEKNNAENIDTLSSFYSAQGLNFYKLMKLNLQNKATEIGVSSSDTKKDF